MNSVETALARTLKDEEDRDGKDSKSGGGSGVAVLKSLKSQ